MTQYQPGELPLPRISEQYFMNWLRGRMNASSKNIYVEDTSEPYQMIQCIHPLNSGSDGGFKIAYIYPSGINIKFFYKDCKYVTDVITKRTIEQQWTPNNPVFISAQTGSGKTMFTLGTLLEQIILDKADSDDSVLLLHNRTALGRQNKYRVAEQAIAYGDSSFYHDLQEHYQPKGIDSLCVNFKNVDIYSYQQLRERDVLKEKTYKYIICDECHFFTSDATFNEGTYGILKYIVSNGKDAVRIYMSATPETAFEPIIRMEWRYLENKKKKMIEELRKSKPSILTGGKNVPFLFSKDDISCLNSPLTVSYYHLKRHYDYIDQIYVYRSDKELLEKIKETASDTQKWLVFVHAKGIGESMNRAIDSAGISCDFIAADNKNKDGKETYDYLVENESFTQKVLVATSVLDNGINIKDENVRHVAIDNVDRVEFLQMLGRIRVPDNNPDFKINLYVRYYSNEDLEKFVQKNAAVLVEHLYWDIVPRTEQGRMFNQRLKSSDSVTDDNSYHEYNPCEIYQMLDSLGYSVQILRNQTPGFRIKFDDQDLEAKRARLIQWYRDGEGLEKAWGRTLIDVIESKKDSLLREKYKSEDLYHTSLDRYQYTLNDNFMAYIFLEMIPRTLMDLLDSQFASFFSMLPDDIRIYIQNLLEREKASHDDFPFKKGNIISNDRIRSELSPDAQNRLSHYTDYAASIKEEVAFYRTLGDNDVTELLQAQLKWLGRAASEAIFIGEKRERKSSDSGTYEDFIMKHAVSMEELEKQKTSGKYYTCNFLEEHGFLKGSPEAEKISEDYLGGRTLTDECKNKKDKGYTIAEKGPNGECVSRTYELISCQANRNENKTFYVYVLSPKYGQTTRLDAQAEELSDADSKQASPDDEG